MKRRPIFLRCERQTNGLRFREVEVGWLRGWLIKVFRPQGWWILEVGWNPALPIEPVIHCPKSTMNLEAFRQVVAWAEKGEAPRIISKHYHDEMIAVIGTAVSKPKAKDEIHT